MKKMTRAMGPAVVISANISAIGASALRMSAIGLSAAGIFLAALPERALAQTDTAPLDRSLGGVTWPVAGEPSGMAGPLPPAEILAEVRREGYYPIGRPALRGRVYALFAVDQDDMDVKLTVDAASGRVLWVAGAVARVGGPGYYGRPLWRAERPPVPPADIPGAAPSNRTHRATGASHAALKRFPPLPRTRPMDLAGVPRAQDEPQATAASPVLLVPVAPLE